MYAGLGPQLILRGQEQEAEKALGQMIEIFRGKENYFVELHNHGIEEQAQLVPELIRLAKKFDLKTVASNDVHYVKGEDWAPHDALLCIQTGSKLDDVDRMRYEAGNFTLSLGRRWMTFSGSSLNQSPIHSQSQRCVR